MHLQKYLFTVYKIILTHLFRLESSLDGVALPQLVQLSIIRRWSAELQVKLPSLIWLN